jgi:predicted RNA methylase
MASPKLGNRRVTGKERYYTHPDLADRLTDVMFSIIGSKADQLQWIEPAGGTGSFINALTKRGVDNIVSFDIEPHHPRVQKADFLETQIVGTGMIAITNPPFGRANKLCIPFFNKLAEHCSHIGFIVPKSWRKWSVQDRLHHNFHLAYDEDLVVNYVSSEGTPLANGKMNLNTVFQVWNWDPVQRPRHIVEDRGYIQKTTPAHADVSLTIFGRGCGTVKTEFPRTPNTTQMFLKISDDNVLDGLQNANFSQFFNNVAYIEALSIKEINHALNEYFDARNHFPVTMQLF